MPTVNCGFDNLVDLIGRGPTLQVNIGFDPEFRPGRNNRPRLEARDILFPALIDTGATRSCIDNTLALELDLPTVDQETMAGIGGLFLSNIYVAQIDIPDLRVVYYGRFSGVNLSEGGVTHRVLLGRSFLQHFALTYEGRTGAVTISSD